MQLCIHVHVHVHDHEKWCRIDHVYLSLIIVYVDQMNLLSHMKTQLLHTRCMYMLYKCTLVQCTCVYMYIIHLYMHMYNVHCVHVYMYMYSMSQKNVNTSILPSYPTCTCPTLHFRCI